MSMLGKMIEHHAIKCGWRWMSWVGIPVRGAEGYPVKCRVRQLISPRQLASPHWKRLFFENKGREADGTEPLAYAYDSSQGAIDPPPSIITPELGVGLARHVRSLWKDAPHGIGIELSNIVHRHLEQMFSEE